MFKRRNVEVSKEGQQASELENLLTNDWQVSRFLPLKTSLIDLNFFNHLIMNYLLIRMSLYSNAGSMSVCISCIASSVQLKGGIIEP